ADPARCAAAFDLVHQLVDHRLDIRNFAQLQHALEESELVGESATRDHELMQVLSAAVVHGRVGELLAQPLEDRASLQVDVCAHFYLVSQTRYKWPVCHS